MCTLGCHTRRGHSGIAGIPEFSARATSPSRICRSRLLPAPGGGGGRAGCVPAIGSRRFVRASADTVRGTVGLQPTALLEREQPAQAGSAGTGCTPAPGNGSWAFGLRPQCQMPSAQYSGCHARDPPCGSFAREFSLPATVLRPPGPAGSLSPPVGPGSSHSSSCLWRAREA